MKFLSYSNMWIAAAAFSHTTVSYILFGKTPDHLVSSFIFCATLFLYNFLRIMKMKTIPSENHSEQLKWVGKNIKTISIITLLSLIGCMTLFFFLSRWQMLIVMVSGIIGFGYNIVVTKNGMSLRKIPFMKAIWISSVWTLLTLVLPISENGIHLGGEVFILRFLFIFILTIPFDIRDLKYDDVIMRTMPQVLGVKGSILFGWILLATCMCLAFSIFHSELAMIISLSYLFTGITLLFSLKERKEIFYPMVVDGMIVLQAILVWSLG